MLGANRARVAPSLSSERHIGRNVVHEPVHERPLFDSSRRRRRRAWSRAAQTTWRAVGRAGPRQWRRVATAAARLARVAARQRLAVLERVAAQRETAPRSHLSPLALVVGGAGTRRSSASLKSSTSISFRSSQQHVVRKERAAKCANLSSHASLPRSRIERLADAHQLDALAQTVDQVDHAVGERRGPWCRTSARRRRPCRRWRTTRDRDGGRRARDTRCGSPCRSVARRVDGGRRQERVLQARGGRVVTPGLAPFSARKLRAQCPFCWPSFFSNVMPLVT
jgi:hypothetical protein